eukprot:5342028-Alexandrium_andersonii.AAC.1
MEGPVRASGGRVRVQLLVRQPLRLSPRLRLASLRPSTEADEHCCWPFVAASSRGRGAARRSKSA